MFSILFHLFFSNLDNAKVRAILYTEKEVIYDDVPLLPFSAAKKAIEQEIYAGRLRTIDEVKLCYVSYLDPNDAKTIWRFLHGMWWATIRATQKRNTNTRMINTRAKRLIMVSNSWKSSFRHKQVR